MLSENVKRVLNECMWDLATCADGIPNVVPIGMKFVTEDGKLAIADNFMVVTAANVKANPNVAISAYDLKTMEAFQIKGTAEYITEGPILEAFKPIAEQLFKGAIYPKGAVVVTPTQIKNMAPGPDNNKEL